MNSGFKSLKYMTLCCWLEKNPNESSISDDLFFPYHQDSEIHDADCLWITNWASSDENHLFPFDPLETATELSWCDLQAEDIKKENIVRKRR